MKDALPCFFCHSSLAVPTKLRRRSHWQDKEYEYKRCMSCKGFSLYPILSTRDIAELYSEDYSFENNKAPRCNETNESCDVYSNKGWEHSIRALEKLWQPELRVLDFGCGTESPFLIRAKEMGLSVLGVEWDERVCLLAQSKMQARVETFETFIKTSGSFDIIFLGDVLEHLSPPGPILESLTCRMNSNGRMLIQGPLEANPSLLNLVLYFFAKLRHKKFTSQSPYHVSLATQGSIVKLLERYDLVVDTWEIYTTYWPAPTVGALVSNFSLRGAILFFFQSVDFFVSKWIPSFGNRFLVVAKSRNLYS